METWHPLDGEIPPDPPGAPWHFEAGDPPAEIIRRMRDVWKLRKGGSQEYAQAIFNKAGGWLDYWRAARADSDALDRAGIFVVEPAPGQDGIDALPEGAIAQTAILAIDAARQAILTGRRALWGLAIELSAAAQKPISDRAIPGRIRSNEGLQDAAANRSRAKKNRSELLKKEALKLINAGGSRERLHLRLARQNTVGLKPDTIQRVLKEIEAADPDAFRPTTAPK